MLFVQFEISSQKIVRTLTTRSDIIVDFQKPDNFGQDQCDQIWQNFAALAKLFLRAIYGTV